MNVVTAINETLNEVSPLSVRLENLMKENTKEIAEKIAKSFVKNKNITSFSSSIYNILSSLGTSIIEETVNNYNPNISSNKDIQSKGFRERKITTRLGEINYKREAFYDKNDSGLTFPTDVDLEIIAGNIQNDIRESIAELLIEMPFHEAQKMYEKLTGIKISEGTAYNIFTELGQSANFDDIIPGKSEIDKKLDFLKIENPNHEIHLVIGADGAHEPMREENSKRKGKRGPGFWREAKGFRLYAVIASELDYRIEQIASWHQICDEEEFGKKLQLMSNLIVDRKEKIVAISDGAKWIWKHYRKIFPNATLILDWYHCVQHLHDYAKLQFGVDSPEGKKWLDKTKDRLMESKIETILRGLPLMEHKNDEAKKESENLFNYLNEYKTSINYGEYRKQGLTIGSGGMESANKFVSHVRLKRSGCWWKETHANEMLHLRSAKYNGTLQKIFSENKHKMLENQAQKCKTKLCEDKNIDEIDKNIKKPKLVVIR